MLTGSLNIMCKYKHFSFLFLFSCTLCYTLQPCYLQIKQPRTTKRSLCQVFKTKPIALKCIDFKSSLAPVMEPAHNDCQEQSTTFRKPKSHKMVRRRKKKGKKRYEHWDQSYLSPTSDGNLSAVWVKQCTGWWHKRICTRLMKSWLLDPLQAIHACLPPPKSLPGWSHTFPWDHS